MPVMVGGATRVFTCLELVRPEHGGMKVVEEIIDINSLCAGQLTGIT